MSIGGSSSASTTGKNESETQEESREGSRTEQLILDQAGIDKIIQDVLSQAGSGIKDIFAGEQTAGIFNSTVAAQAAGDLAANLAGEIAKITGKTEVLTAEDALRNIDSKSRETTFSAEAEAKLL